MINWRHIETPIILASQSPRRKEILTQMGLNFKIESPQILDEEAYLHANDIETSLNNLARAKARSIAKQFHDSLIIGADTIVVHDNVILGKPKDPLHAFPMLKNLSGAAHTVMTSVALFHDKLNFDRTLTNITKVYFRNLTNSEIEEYLSIDEYRDKAGAYAIQGKGMIFIDRIEGCYYNVVGLPVSVTIQLLQEFSARKDSAHVRKN